MFARPPQKAKQVTRAHLIKVGAFYSVRAFRLDTKRQVPMIKATTNAQAPEAPSAPS